MLNLLKKLFGAKITVNPCSDAQAPKAEAPAAKAPKAKKPTVKKATTRKPKAPKA